MEPVGYPSSAVERAMKVQEVILRAIDGRLKWYQAAETPGISDRQMRRWKQRYERGGIEYPVENSHHRWDLAITHGPLTRLQSPNP